MKLTLLRHGETEGSQKNLYYGAADIPALPKSLEALQQKALTGVYPTAEHYYVSGMTRTIQTLRAIYGDVAYTVLPGLREMDFGDFEMRAYAGDLEHDPQFIVWCEDSEHNMCPNGESAPQVLARNLAAIQPVIDAGGGRGVRDPRRGDVGTDDALVRRNAVRLSAGTRRGISG